MVPGTSASRAAAPVAGAAVGFLGVLPRPVSAVASSRSVVQKAEVVAGCPRFFRARALGRRFDGVSAAGGDVAQSSARDVVPDDCPPGPDHRGHELDFRRRLVLLLKRQGPGEPRRIPPAQVVVNHIGYHFERCGVLHFAAVLAAMVADQVGAVPEPLTEYFQARGPVFRLNPKGQDSHYGVDQRLQVLDAGGTGDVKIVAFRDVRPHAESIPGVELLENPGSHPHFSLKQIPHLHQFEVGDGGSLPDQDPTFQNREVRQATRNSFARAMITWAIDGDGDGARVRSKYVPGVASSAGSGSPAGVRPSQAEGDPAATAATRIPVRTPAGGPYR